MDCRELTVHALSGVRVTVTALVGTAHLPLKDVLAFSPGTVVDLDSRADAAVSVLVNGLAVARGDIVALEDGSLAVELVEIFAADDAQPLA
jgi:flagellar motor switch protein FliN/FliY